MPFGQVPVLEVDGKLLAQSYAIVRFIAREHGLAGSDNWEQAQVDMYADCIKDLMIGKSDEIYSRLSGYFKYGNYRWTSNFLGTRRREAKGIDVNFYD